MTGKQIGFVFLVALVCAVCNQPRTVDAAVKLCPNTGCWNVQPSERWFSGVGKCWRYNNAYSPGDPMSTTRATGGARKEKVGANVARYISKDACTETCQASGDIEATWAGEWDNDGIIPKWLCE